MKAFTLLALLIPLSGFAFDNAKFEGKIAIDQRVISEMAKFSSDGTKLPSDYISKFASKMRSRIIQEKREFLASIAGKPCVASSKVSFIKAGEAIGSTNYPRAEQDAIDDFEKGIVMIEAVGCLNGKVAQEAMAESRKSSFQMSVVNELKSSAVNGPLTCEKTSVPFLGSSQYCFTSIAASTESESYLFTQNVTNAPVAQASAPVFYRSIYMSFHEVGNQTYSHTIAFVRGPAIPGIAKSTAKSRIQETQTRTFQKLNQIVGKK